jgi:glycosyltransferase involved in cell wall biosynthesis
MLEPWALNRKWWKKRFAWWLYQKGDLKRACYHHTTADSEAKNLQRLGLGVPICVITNGVDVSEVKSAAAAGKKTDGRKTALFLGRIHPKKGLPMLVEAWARVQPDGWQLQIAGPDEAGHRLQVENAVSAAGLSHVISFLGPIYGETKESAFSNSNLFVLPTHSENFGMVIAEALAHGLPVLTTTGAPWSMLPQRGCGWWVDPTVDDIATGLRQATSHNAEKLHEMGANGREWVRAEFGWERIAKEFIAVYERL